MKYIFFVVVASIAGSFGLVNDNSKNRADDYNIPIELIEFTEPLYITVGLWQEKLMKSEKKFTLKLYA